MGTGQLAAGSTVGWRAGLPVAPELGAVSRSEQDGHASQCGRGRGGSGVFLHAMEGQFRGNSVCDALPAKRRQSASTDSVAMVRVGTRPQSMWIN